MREADRRMDDVGNVATIGWWYPNFVVLGNQESGGEGTRESMSYQRKKVNKNTKM